MPRRSETQAEGFHCPACGHWWTIGEWKAQPTTPLQYQSSSGTELGRLCRGPYPPSETDDGHQLPADYAIETPPIVIAFAGRWNSGKSVMIGAMTRHFQLEGTCGDWAVEPAVINPLLLKCTTALASGELPPGTDPTQGQSPADAIMGIFTLDRPSAEGISRRYLVLRDFAGEDLFKELINVGVRQSDLGEHNPTAFGRFGRSVDGVVFCVDPAIDTTLRRGLPPMLPRRWDPGAPDAEESADPTLTLICRAIARKHRGQASYSDIPLSVLITKCDYLRASVPVERPLGPAAGATDSEQKARVRSIIQLGGGNWLRKIHNEFGQYAIHTISVTGPVVSGSPNAEVLKRGNPTAIKPVEWLLDRLVP